MLIIKTMSRSIKGQMTSGKGFFGDLLSSVVQPLASIAGTALGGPIGGILGGGLGSALSPIARRLPFKKGGVVPKGMHMMPDGSLMKDSAMKGKKKTKQPAKGSKAMKMKMARLRAMRK
jgi:hypothetical protein